MFCFICFLCLLKDFLQLKSHLNVSFTPNFQAMPAEGPQCPVLSLQRADLVSRRPCVESRGNQQEREEQRAEQPVLEQRASIRKSSESPTPSCAWQQVPAWPVQKGLTGILQQARAHQQLKSFWERRGRRVLQQSPPSLLNRQRWVPALCERRAAKEEKWGGRQD